MRRASWVVVVVMIACDFDAAYERRCDAGLCGSSGLAGGQGGGGQGGSSTAGGQGGGAAAGGESGGGTAGGQSGGGSSLCATTPTVELVVFDGGVMPISATACVRLHIGLRCQGALLDAGTPIQVGVRNLSTPQRRGGTVFADSSCTTPLTSAGTGEVFFNSTSAGAQSYSFGNFEVSVDAGVVGLTRVVQLEPGFVGSFTMVLLPVNTCLTLPPISFVGLTDSIPVAAPGQQVFSGTLVSPLEFCDGTSGTVVVNAGASTSSVVPHLTSSVPSIAGSGLLLYGDAGQISYFVRPCLDGGRTLDTSLCCNPSGAAFQADGGIVCL